MDNEQLHMEDASVHYIPFLEQLNQRFVTNKDVESTSKPAHPFPHAADDAVERLIPYSLRSQDGIFFTPDSIARRCSELVGDEIRAAKSFFDPACGAGNLLIAVARVYQLESDVQKTLEVWGRKFGGCDINQSFVHVAKLRLVGLALERHKVGTVSEHSLNKYLDLFKSFYVADYLDSDYGAEFDCIVANPPFGHRVLEKESWAAGKTQLAAIFMDKILKTAHLGQRVVAVLPDVLRSGTRYKRWRSMVSTTASELSVHSYGRFTNKVDVDVFLLAMDVAKARNSNSLSSWVEDFSKASNSYKLDEFCMVRIGPVVPHRIRNDESLVPYICVKSCPPFTEVEAAGQIPFNGTLYIPPFVVVRRTSNPSDKKRVVSTLVKGHEPIGVENHLIIIKPNDGRVDTCRKLMSFLQSVEVARQLNSSIRCRHLTKVSLASLVISEAGI